MNFGKWLRLLREETLPEWREYYVCYKILKKLIKVIVAAAAIDDNNNNYNNDYEVIFIHLFKAEVNKINKFMEKKCTDCSVRFQVMKDRIQKINNMEEANESAGEDTINEVIIIGKNLVNFYGELVLLENYSVWNYTGLMKILKKYDKQTNAALGKRYMELVKFQPCFQATGSLSHPIKECQSIFQSLPFSSLFGDNMAKFVMIEIFHNENEDEQNVYKSSVAALKILEEMMKINSAYNDDSS